MTSYERVMNAVNRISGSPIPVGPFMGNHAAAVTGMKLRDYYTSGTSMFKAQKEAWELYGQDILLSQSDNYYIAEGFGTKATYYENSTPTFAKGAISSLNEVDHLQVPDPYKDGRMPVYLEAIELLKDKFKYKVAIRGGGTGPFSLASHLLGTERFLEALASAEYEEDTAVEEAVFQLMEICCQALINFAKAQILAGADMVTCGDSLASLDVISPYMYEKYAFPYEKKYAEELRPLCKEHNAFTMLHICGDNTKVMELYPKTGCDILEVDYKCDLEYYKQSIGDKMILIGNLNPTACLLQDTPQGVYNVSCDCIQKASKGGGFILGSGCEVPMYAPKANMEAMVAAARAHVSM